MNAFIDSTALQTDMIMMLCPAVDHNYYKFAIVFLSLSAYCVLRRVVQNGCCKPYRTTDYMFLPWQ